MSDDDIEEGTPALWVCRSRDRASPREIIPATVTRVNRDRGDDIVLHVREERNGSVRTFTRWGTGNFASGAFLLIVGSRQATVGEIEGLVARDQAAIMASR